LDQELHDLIPVFVEEARDRLDRLATRVPRLGDDADALVVVKRELHTLKGSARMLQLDAMAELCHAAEDAVAATPDDLVALLTRAVDRLVEMLETVAGGEIPQRDAGLVARLRGQAAGETAAKAKKKPAKTSRSGGSSRTKGKAAGRKATGEKTSGKKAPGAGKAGDEVEAAADGPAEAADDGEVRIGTDRPGSDHPGGDKDDADAGDGAAAARDKGATSLTSSDIRVEAVALDEVADRATQLRLMALGATHVGERMYELAHLA
jgi:chemotaxis protein histidine kinase CheA